MTGTGAAAPAEASWCGPATETPILPLLAAISACLAVAVVIVAGGASLWRLRDTPASVWAIGLTLAAAGLLARIWLVPGYQRIYTDEPGYLALGCEMARHGLPGPADFAKAFGWPAILAVSCAVAPASHDLSLQVNGLLAAGTILGASLWAYGITRGQAASLWAGLLVASWPLHALWTRTGEAHVASGLLTILMVATTCAVREGGTRRGAVLIAASLALATSVRPELATLALLGLFVPAARGALAAGLVWSLPNLLLYGQVHLDVNAGRASGLTLTSLTGPWRLLAAGSHTPWVLPVLAGIGLLVWEDERQSARSLAAMVAVLLAGLSAAGASGLTEPERFGIAPGVVLAVLGGLGMQRLHQRLDQGRRVAQTALHACMAVVLLATVAPMWRSLGGVKPGYALQQGLAVRVADDLPAGCTLVALHPELYRGVVSAPIREAHDLSTLPEGCHVFVWDLPCFEWRSGPGWDICKQAEAGTVLAIYEPLGLSDTAGRQARLIRVPARH